jgi:2'-5' RNA ligase
MTQTPNQGFFALVAYVPDPLAGFLHEMRRNLCGSPCPQPHVTILPPRPLHVPAESACQTAGQILQSQHPFEVELSHISYFVNTNTLYLDINDGASELHAIHDRLNHGDLYHQEEFAFRPHLTVAGLVTAQRLPEVLQQAEAYWRAARLSPRFLLSEIVCLLQDAMQDKDNWRRSWSIKMNPATSQSSLTPCDLFANADQQ